MNVFDRYVMRNLAVATAFIGLTLAIVVFLTQSLKFLELVLESGASGSSFWILTFLALPRFFEVILPIALLAAIIFIYNRMAMDSELVAIKSSGYSPMALARPAIVLSCVICVLLWAVTMWASPKSLGQMQYMRQVIKAQFSALLFREGVFNQVGKGLTVYMRERGADGELRGLMIHDTRDTKANPSTVMAKRGVIVVDPDGEQVVVYDGSRQEYDPNKKILHRLNFERYTIDLPESNPVRQRWREPEERTILELLNPDAESRRDPKIRHEFLIEIHRRITNPLLALAFTLITCASLLLGPVDRRGQSKKIVIAIASSALLETLFVSAFNLSKKTIAGVPLLYLLVLLPSVFAFFLLSSAGEKFRRKLLYKPDPTA